MRPPRPLRPRRGAARWAAAGALAALLPAAAAAAEPQTPAPPGTCLSGAEAELGRLVNAYRAAHGLPPVPLTRSLSKVAKWHAVDLQDFGAAQARDARGQPCGLHSWSARGPWSAVCYTADHKAADAMWRKPRELTDGKYPGFGFENVYFTSEPVSPERALSYWQGMPDQDAVILERGVWSRGRWPAMGVGIYGQYVVLWFGDAKDPLGVIRACSDVDAPSPSR